MAKCFSCGAETNLFVNGAPLCRACDEKMEALAEEKIRLALGSDASEPFADAVSHPDPRNPARDSSDES